MGDLKAIGSEKLTGQDKIKRIMEIARYGESTKNTEYHTHTNSFTKRAANGVTYAIVHEKDGYYVKSGLNESELEYVDGLANKRKNRYRSYSAALKRVNLMLKPINEQYNNGRGDSMYEQEEVVIKTKPTPPAPPAPAAPAPPVPAAPVPPAPAAPAPPVPMGDEGMDMDMDDEDMDIDMDIDMGDEDMDMGDEEGFDAEEQIPTIKSIQKLTGKLGQKMREYADDMDSDAIKYVLNSVIAAVDLEELDDEDRDDIISRLEPELEDDYGMDDELDVDADIEGDMDMEVDVDMGGGSEDDMDAAFDDMGLEESLKRRVNGTLKRYFKETEHEKGRRLFKKNATKGYINEQIARSKSKSIPSSISETIEQELKVKEVLNTNKNIKFKGKTKSGTLVFEGNVRRIGITKKGEIIR